MDTFVPAEPAARPDFYSERVVKGRRAHYCTFCRHEIPAGAVHAYVSRCSCGSYATHRAHLECQAAAAGRPVDASTVVATP